MIPYDVLVDALEAWKAQTAPPPQSPDAYVAEDHLAEDVAGEEPPTYAEPEEAPEGVEMMDSEMVVLDEDEGETEDEPSYEMEIDEAVSDEPYDASEAEAPAGPEDDDEPTGD